MSARRGLYVDSFRKSWNYEDAGERKRKAENGSSNAILRFLAAYMVGGYYFSLHRVNPLPGFMGRFCEAPCQPAGDRAAASAGPPRTNISDLGSARTEAGRAASLTFFLEAGARRLPKSSFRISFSWSFHVPSAVVRKMK